jgi:hypothetical protein
VKLKGLNADDLAVRTIQLARQKPRISSRHSAKLGENLERDGQPEPKPTRENPATYEAAHLVPSSDQVNRSPEVHQAVQVAKAALESAGIDGDAAINGFWTNHSTQLGTSTDKYFLELGRVMRRANAKGPKAVKKALRDLLVRVKDEEFVK